MKEIDNIIKNIERSFGDKELEVGFFEDSIYDKNNTPVAYIASIQEYGAPGISIPPRPFMRPTLIDNEGKWEDIILNEVDYVIDNGVSGNVFETLGKEATNSIKNSIEKVFRPILKPSTLKNRSSRGNSSTKPLIDTGKMIDSVTYKIS